VNLLERFRKFAMQILKPSLPQLVQLRVRQLGNLRSCSSRMTLDLRLCRRRPLSPVICYGLPN
jgi:hypothetical protein